MNLQDLQEKDRIEKRNSKKNAWEARHPGDMYVDDKWILVKGKPRKIHSLIKWGKWFQDGNRIARQEHFGKYEVSTVFLGMDYNFFPKRGKPVVWETMVFRTMTKKEVDKKNADLLPMLKRMRRDAKKRGDAVLPKLTGFYKYGQRIEEVKLPMRRYTSRAAALAGHRTLVKMVKKLLK